MNLETACLVLCMLFFGSYNTINSKLIYQITCPTLPSGTHLFNKPWMTNMIMFLGEASLLIPYNWKRMTKRAKRGYNLEDTLLPSQKAPFYIFAIPASCDVVGTGISAVAMMLIDAAVWQMMRGAVVVFSAILSVVFLRRKLHAYHWIGVFFTVVGLACIGGTAIIEEQAKSGVGSKAAGNASLGVALVLFAQVFSAFQFTFEEHLLTGYSVSSLKTVGNEGIWGIMYMLVVLTIMTNMPGPDHGVYESVPDGLHMISGSSQMQVLVGTYMASIAFYNFMGMQLCRKLSAVTRCLVDCMRTVVVWGFQLAVHYGISDQYGQPWTQYSYLQVIGFGFLVLGTLIYNGVVRLPAMDYRRLDVMMPQKVLQATWSPTVNRAAAYGYGPQYGPQSPHAPDSPPISPMPSPSDPAVGEYGQVADQGEMVISGVEA